MPTWTELPDMETQTEATINKIQPIGKIKTKTIREKIDEQTITATITTEHYKKPAEQQISG